MCGGSATYQVVVRGQPVEVGFLLLPQGSWGLNSDHQP